MGDTVITIIAIFLAAILMFIVPMTTISNRTDDISDMVVETATIQYVDNIRTTGVLSTEDYQSFVNDISSTGNVYDVEFTLQVLDENPGKKVTQAEYTKIGENVYFNKYTTQVLSELEASSSNEEAQAILLKEGDIVSVKVKNTNLTIAQQLQNFFYTVTGNDVYAIGGQHGGVVTANGGN